jgi:LytS/YehU family sensor histidine kinase
MDPHFTMNTINAVIDAINRERKEEARDNLVHFSKLYRSLILSADRIKRTLQEELEFTRDYLALEQFRFLDQFTWEIVTDDNVSLYREVPKMVIQAPVENAIKHGLLKKEGAGRIRIHVSEEENRLIIEVTDDGIGRAKASAEQNSTGKGMQIMEQFFDLYYKVTGLRVTSAISDLYDPETGVGGTRVVTTIELGKGGEG